jgi:NADPH:quinone reductase-like Zn-dependent oxidoreductase
MQAFGRLTATMAPDYSASYPLPPPSLFSHYGPVPDAARCQVLIEVAYSSVSPSDVHPTMAETDWYPKAMGSDAAGCIRAIRPRNATGSALDSGGCRFGVGDCVFGDIGSNTHVAQAGGGGAKTKELGGYSQFAVAFDSQIARIPAGMSLKEAGSLPKVALTSLKALTWYAGYPDARGPGSRILILGGSSATGLVALQLARLWRASNITTTTSTANFDLVRSLGATNAIDYRFDDWWEDRVIPPRSFDVVYDCVSEGAGVPTGDRAVAKLRPGGAYVTIVGALARGPLPPNVSQHMFINSDTNLNSVQLLEEVARLGVRMPVFDSTFSLRTLAQGFARSASGRAVGKVSVQVPPPSVQQVDAAKALWRGRGGMP